jgi:hypothetical protein
MGQSHSTNKFNPFPVQSQYNAYPDEDLSPEQKAINQMAAKDV